MPRQKKAKREIVVTPQPIDILKALVKMDLDAMKGYEHALRRVKDDHGLREQLERCYSDHKAHLERLEQTIAGLGGTAPAREANLHGFFPNTLETLKSMTCSESIVAAIKIGEKVTNRTYETALQMQMPDHVRNIIKSCYCDEQEHLKLMCGEQKAKMQQTVVVPEVDMVG